MYAYEIRKYCKNKLFWICFLGFIVLKIVVSYCTLKVNTGFSDEIYRDYIAHIEGPISEETEKFISGEKARLDNIFEMQPEYERMYQHDEISFEKFADVNDEYLYAQAQLPAFEALCDKYEYLLSVDDGQLFYDLDIAELAMNVSDDFVLILVMCFGIIISYDIENRGGIDGIIRSLPVGKQTFSICKVLGALTMTSFAVVIFYGIDIAVYATKYSFDFWDRMIYNIPVMSTAVSNMPVYVYFLLILFMKLIISYMMVAFVCFISSVSKKKFLVMLISITIFYLPILCRKYLPDWISGLFVPTVMIGENIIIYILSSLFISLILIIATIRERKLSQSMKR